MKRSISFRPLWAEIPAKGGTLGKNFFGSVQLVIEGNCGERRIGQGKEIDHWTNPGAVSTGQPESLLHSKCP